MISRSLTFLGAALIGSIAVAFPAAAGWQHTDWGMSPAEVVEASNGDAWEQYGDNYQNCRYFAQGEYQAARYQFDVRFCFDNDEKLVLVHLNPIRIEDESEASGTFKGLKDELIASYGKPVEGIGLDDLAKLLGSGRELMWRDSQGANKITLGRVEDLVYLVYRPLKQGL